MKQDTPSELDSLKLRRLSRLVFVARAVLLWERLWNQTWPIIILASLFSITVLFDLLPTLPSYLHMLVLAGVGLSGIALCLRIIQRTSLPSIRDGLHRLEKDSGLHHQPLIALLDQPTGPTTDKIGQSLWIKHQDRMASAIKNISLKIPRSTLWKKDPYSIRAVFIILLVLGSIEARFDYAERLARAFIPMAKNSIEQQWQVQAWITPPVYTNLGPMLFSANADHIEQTKPIIAPQHSHLLIRLEGQVSGKKVTLSVGPFEEDLTDLGKGVFSLETSLDQGTYIDLWHDEEKLISWPLLIQADQAPEIVIKGNPKRGTRGHFTLAYAAQDDYGLDQASLNIHAMKPDGLPDIVLNSSIQGTEVNGVFRHNLADHPWAGKEVILTPKAMDHAGQVTHGFARIFVLPERKFKHPIAQSLVNLRKNLYDSSPEDHIYAHLWIARLLDKPEKFNHDIAIYFALRVAADRLHPDITQTDIKTIQAILWETAVRLDEGVGATVRDQLEFMSRQMQDLMKQGDQAPAMEALFEAMRQSLDQFLQQASISAQSTKGFEEAMGADNIDSINRDELIKMLERARDLMRSGNVKAAKALIDQFQAILSRLAMQKKIDPAQTKLAQDIMEKLRKIEKDQQDLLDKTFKRSRNAQHPSIESTRQAIQEADQQEELIKHLKNEFARLKKMNAKVSDALQKAETAMTQSAHALQKGLDESSVQSQTQALEHLHTGLKESATELAQKLGMQSMPPQMPGYDPLGRGSPARMDSLSGQEIPTEAEIHKSREILKELYRRAGQPDRAEQELKYIERLLERF